MIENNVNNSEAKKNMAKDTFLYLPAKAIEGIIGIVTISLYTRYFRPEEYGNYNIAVVTVSIVALVLLGWLFQSAYRYINSFTGEENIKAFYSTVFVGWAIISVLVVAISIAALIFAKSYFFIDTFYLILLSIFMFVTYSINQILFACLSAARVIKLNLALSILSGFFKLLITTILVKFFYQGIQSAIISIILVDTATALIIIIRLKIYKFIKPSLFSPNIMKKLARYGMPLVGVSLSLSLLNNADRYLVKIFLGSSDAGIYIANYSIASSVFSMLLLAIMRGVYPNILKTWKQDEKVKTEDLLSHAVRFFLLISVPAVVGISLLSATISKILDPLYTSGNSVIIWVSIGMFFLGLSEYNNKAWELSSKTGAIFRNSSICCVFNIVLNVLLIRHFGYKIAAVNTALAYFLYFILSFIGGRKLLKWHLPFITYARIFSSSALMGIVLYLSIKTMPTVNVAMLFVFVPLGVLVYAAALYFTGEIKDDLSHAIAEIKEFMHRK